MSRWFRHYAGMMRDEKLVRVAVKSKQTVERVVWVWGAILESAAEINDAGRYEFDAGEAAYFLRCDDDDLVCILQCLDDLGRVSGGVVVRWDERQFNSDSAKERQRRYRERRKAGSDVSELHDDVGQASQPITRDVTPPSRDAEVTLQETDTETDITDAIASDAIASDPRDDLWKNGVSLLKAATGKTDGAARSMIGKWLKASGDDCALVLAKIRTAHAERIGEPVAWITAALAPPKPPPREPRNPGERAMMRLQNGYGHESPNPAPGHLDASDGRRQIEGTRADEPFAYRAVGVSGY